MQLRKSRHIQWQEGASGPPLWLLKALLPPADTLWNYTERCTHLWNKFSFQCLLHLDSTYKQYRQTREWIRLQFNLPRYEGRTAAVQRHWPWMSLVPRLGLVVLDLLFASCIHTKITHRLCQCLSSYKHTGVELSLIWTSFLLLLTVWTLHCWFSILIIQLLLLLH